MRVLLIIPPMVQINAPYPATAYLAGTLLAAGHEVHQADASLMLALRLFSRPGIHDITREARRRRPSPGVRRFLRHARQYAETIEAVIHFLQGHAPSLARRIASRDYLPEGPRFSAFGETGAAAPLTRHDMAIHLDSLYLDDLADAIHDGIDPRFELARYGETLAASAPSFDGLAQALNRRPTLVDRYIGEITRDLVNRHHPDLVGFTVPFPGNVYGAFRMARVIKRLKPGLPVVMGGGYVNTELRTLRDPRPFNDVDYLVYDDGATPLLKIIDQCKGRIPASQLQRTLIRRGQRVRLLNRHPPSTPSRSSHHMLGEPPDPVFAGLPLDQYFSMIENPNPMHRIWSCGQWNKLMLAHGCYWHRCAFCDTTLDYIGQYAPVPVDALIRQIESVIQQTGRTGFHFIDEAMPPALLRSLSRALLRRGLKITWWGNIRFDKAFTPELADLMAEAGCIAVTGGLEAATNRLLTLLDKGFTIEQAARVTHAFAGAGILVHAYLMYGCPSQTSQDTVDSLEFVRQLFEAGCIQSAYWHRFALTVHSPIFKRPARYGIRIPRLAKSTFARNEIAFADSVQCDHDAMGRGLRASLYNYMQGRGLDFAIQDWFDVPVPPPTLGTDFVASQLDLT